MHRPAFRSLLSAAAAALALACGARDRADAHLRSVHVAGVRIDPRAEVPIVDLVEDGGAERKLGIWVGEFEADSIARAMAHEPAARPNPHDLLKNLLDSLDAHVRRTVVTELRAGTYFAEIDLELRGRRISIDARPSDAIAIALRAGAPMLVQESLFESAEPPGDEPSLDIDWRTHFRRETRGAAPL